MTTTLTLAQTQNLIDTNYKLQLENEKITKALNSNQDVISDEIIQIVLRRTFRKNEIKMKANNIRMAKYPTIIKFN